MCVCVVCLSACMRLFLFVRKLVCVLVRPRFMLMSHLMGIKGLCTKDIVNRLSGRLIQTLGLQSGGEG